MGNIEKILADLIRFDTSKEKTSNTCIVEYICAILEKHDLSYARLKNNKSGLESIVAGINTPLKDSTPTLMLSGHMDTVVTNENVWHITKPLEPVLQEGKLYGLGAADMKSAIAVFLASIEEFKKTGQSIVFSFTNDEETDIESIKDVIAFLNQQNVKPKYAFLGEPTDLHLATQSTGYMAFKTTINGEAGHSTSKDKATPIFVGAQVMLFIEKMNIAYKELGTFFHVGVAKGGECRNSIPTSFEFDWEMRFVHKGATAVAIHHVMRLHDEIRTKNKIDIMVKVFERIPSYVEGKHTEIVKTMSKILDEKKRFRITYATEAGFIKAYGPKTVIFGPGKEELAHQGDEYVEIANLYKYQNVLLQFLEKQKTK